MSTAGSVRSTEAAAYTPPAAGSGGSDGTGARRVRVFRWRGIIPLALGLAVAFGAWLVLGERVVRDTVAEAGTKALGTQLDVAAVAIDELRTTVELRGVAIANPFDPRRNVLEASVLRVELEPEPLLEKKLVIRRLAIGNVRTNTSRTTPARPVAGGGFAPTALREVQRWAKQFDVPVLSLTPIDTIKSIVLDPTQLKSVGAALSLTHRADSVRAGLERGYGALRLPETLDSTRALLTRLQRANLRTLGVDGVRTAIADLRRAAARLDSVRRRVEQLASAARSGVDSLEEGVRGLDAARKDDYAFARGLLALPSFDAPDLGAAFFGQVTIEKFQQAVYWTELARRYAPPGLLPRESDGPQRLRRAGTTVHFVTAKATPRFLLQRADASLTVSDGPARGTYLVGVADATTEPTLVGRPTRFVITRRTAGSDVDSPRIVGLLDHTGARPRDLFTITATGVKLPAVALPLLPYRADPGNGRTELQFSLDGDQLRGTWTLASGTLAWLADSARARALNPMESLVARVLTGVRQLDLTAEVSGTLRAPRLAVRSNLDRVVADRLRAVAGEALAAAEARVRARVDSLVEERSAPVQARIAELRSEAERRIADARAQLDAERRKLDAQAKSLGGGLLRLP